MEEAPTLRLEIVQGPRAGEALEFKPGKKVGIGRLARGNAIQIKDDGISSKHTCIEFDSGKWLIKDLESSNGTILNGAAVDPLVPTLLCDGDVVKIGECTSITVRFEVRESVGVFGEGNVRRNPRRRAAVPGKYVVTESVQLVESKRARVTEGDVGGGIDLDEKKKKSEEGNDGECVVENRGRKGASKRNNVKNVDDNRPELQVVEDSDVKLEYLDEVVETGLRRGRPKKINAVKGVGEAAVSVLAGDEGLKAGSQAVKESRGGRGVRKGRVLKEKYGEDESAVAGQLVKSTCDERGGLRNGRALNKKIMEVESAMVDGKCEKALQSVQLEDGIKKRTRCQARKAQLVKNEVVKETLEEKEILNSENVMQGKSVNIKKEKFSICPSIVPESLWVNSRGSVFENEKNLDDQVLDAVENGVSEKVNHETILDSHETLEADKTCISGKAENVKSLDSHEPLFAAGVHYALEESKVLSESHKKKEINDSENGMNKNLQKIKKEKLSTCTLLHEKIPEFFCINSSESEFVNERNSTSDESKATNDGLSENVGGMAGLESHEPLEVVGVLSGVAASAERIDSGRQASQGFQADPGHEGINSGRGNEVNLEEMTLGEWFDYLETYLPRQIHDATEEMIASMIEKSKRFKEYVSQQQKGKGKVPAR